MAVQLTKLDGENFLNRLPRSDSGNFFRTCNDTEKDIVVQSDETQSALRNGYSVETGEIEVRLFTKFDHASGGQVGSSCSERWKTRGTRERCLAIFLRGMGVTEDQGMLVAREGHRPVWVVVN